jgi:hypothetical protein
MPSSDTPRSVLPIPACAHMCLTTYDAQDPDTSSQFHDYTSADATFNGKVKWVQLDAALDDHDRLITPEERFRVAMAVQ